MLTRRVLAKELAGRVARATGLLPMLLAGWSELRLLPKAGVDSFL